LEFGLIVNIRRSEKILPLAVLPELAFFGIGRQKLKWSGSTTWHGRRIVSPNI
jgi:hypothetical protein